ncbi:HlyD family secretion protein [Emticicia sp. 17c]|uniref:HlyD family secretion protein n=1 Tax=Emticicia sp. 17c TaxID=3127704 RepID=UPI00301D8E55
MNTKVIIRVVGVIVLIAALFYGYKEIQYLQRYETTDDAQIDGDVDPVTPKIGGYIKEIRFKDNQPVKAGDTLFIIDDADYRIRVTQAEAALQTAEAGSGVSQLNIGVAAATIQTSQANVQTARNQVSTAQANVAAAQVRAQKANRDFDRYSRLLAEKTIPQQQFDNVQAERDAAQAALQAAQSQLETAQLQVNAANTQTGVTSSQRKAIASQAAVSQATIKQRQAELELARLQLSYTVVVAPAAGVVSKRSVQVGQLIQPGQALCSIVTTNNLWVTANFKETQLTKMEIGQPVDIEVDAFGDEKLTGKVESFAGATGAKFSLIPPDNATGNYVKVVQRVPVRIEVDKNSPVFAKLRPGLSVGVAVDVQKK